MLLGEVLQRVISLYNKGVQSDDTRLTHRHVYNATASARATLIRQRSDKNQYIGEWAYQPLPCVELVPYKTLDKNCTTLRSKYKIPQTITDIDCDLIRSVTTLDGMVNFDPSTFETEKYSDGDKYTANKPSYYLRNGYLYVTMYKMLKAVTVTGLFADPITAYFFPSGTCPSCEDCMDRACTDPVTIEFPFDVDAISTLVGMAANELVNIMKQISEDKNADSSDDDESSKIIHQPQPQQ